MRQVPNKGGFVVLGALALAAAGCALHRNPAPTGDAGEIVRDQLVIHSDFNLPRHHRLLEELTAQRGDITRLLALPVSDEPIHVYLFESPLVYESFIQKRFPQLPKRRAFFVETDTSLSVYAHWGDRMAEDLRHEVAHGYLHAVVPNLPLWLDEGLAEYFEVPRGWRGLNQPHVEMLVDELRRGQWTPDLARLEQFQSAADMTQRDYAESWAWTHMLLETTTPRRELLTNYLARLRTEGSAPPMSHVVGATEASLGQSLTAHLMVLSSRAPRGLPE
ncbi:MAG: DUF1570 domain-containing protein [Pirellulaceae bacterium]|nr:DUF1570 domain-containing protein [Pirellulaceae bacterium]